MAIRGAVIAIEIKWDCDLDLDFMTHCLPKYSFDILDDTGWNFRHAWYHEENRRTLIKAYGMKFLININGNAGKFDITRTSIIIVTGLGMMGLANIMCDLVLLKSSNRYREQIAEKKYEQIEMSSINGNNSAMTAPGFGRRLTMRLGVEKKRKATKSELCNDQLTPIVTAATNTAEGTPNLTRNENLVHKIDGLVDAL